MSTGQARDAVGKALGVSGKSIDHTTKVLKQGTPELVKAVDEGRMAIGTPTILAGEPAEGGATGSRHAHLLRLKAERDENTCRKDLNPTEAIEQGRRIEEALKPAAKERKATGKSADGQAGGRGRKRKPSSDSDEGLSEENSRRTDIQAAEAVGMKRDRYVKARAVMEAADEYPEHFGDLPAKMDKTGNRLYAVNQEICRGLSGENQPVAKSKGPGARPSAGSTGTQNRGFV